MTLALRLQELIRRAAEQPAPPGRAAHHKRRLDSAGAGQVILADVSESMAAQAWGGQRKIDVLRAALSTAPPARVIAFASAPVLVIGALPEPSGSTAMHRGLELAASLAPAHTLVISDGQPDDEASALTIAERVPGVIDVLYVGPDSDKTAIAFMRRLARVGAGRYAGHDLVRIRAELCPVIRGLLGPAGSGA